MTWQTTALIELADVMQHLAAGNFETMEDLINRLNHSTRAIATVTDREDLVSNLTPEEMMAVVAIHVKALDVATYGRTELVIKSLKAAEEWWKQTTPADVQATLKPMMEYLTHKRSQEEEPEPEYTTMTTLPDVVFPEDF